MERRPHQPGGGEQRDEAETEPGYEQLTDEQLIQRGIADALNEDRAVDDATARRIAALLHGGPDSALYALASTGALPDGVEQELADAGQALPPEQDSWTDALLAYVEVRGEDRGSRGSWATASTNDPEHAIEAARSAASRERRADRARLERYVALGMDPGDAEAVIEFEHLSPQQRAEWAGWGEPSSDHIAHDTAERMGREAVSAASATEQEPSPRPLPRIYIACLAAYNNGRMHGVWLDATRNARELQAEVQAMLAASPVPEAEDFAIHDHEGFTGYPLGEHESLEFLHRLARGIAEHGQAFAAYADWIGRGDEELERFADHYEGTYPTREAWAGELADEVFEWPRYLEAIPEPLRSHVTLDLTSFALNLEQDRHVVAGDEGVYVFNPHA